MTHGARTVRKLRCVQTLRSTAVVVQHAAQALPPTHRSHDVLVAKRLDQFVLKTLMVPLRVVVRHELCQCTPEMVLTEQDQTVQAFLFDGAHEPLCIGVAVGRVRRCSDDPNALMS